MSESHTGARPGQQAQAWDRVVSSLVVLALLSFMWETPWRPPPAPLREYLGISGSETQDWHCAHGGMRLDAFIGSMGQGWRRGSP